MGSRSQEMDHGVCAVQAETIHATPTHFDRVDIRMISRDIRHSKPPAEPHTAARWLGRCYCWPSPLRSRRCCLLCLVMLTLPCCPLLDWPRAHCCSPGKRVQWFKKPHATRLYTPTTSRWLFHPALAPTHQPTRQPTVAPTFSSNRATNTCANCKAEPAPTFLYQPLKHQLSLQG
jgi:hypothetical protein